MLELGGCFRFCIFKSLFCVIAEVIQEFYPTLYKRFLGGLRIETVAKMRNYPRKKNYSHATYQNVQLFINNLQYHDNL
jgi:hypothetical protein